MSGLPPDRPANFNNTGFENYTSPKGDPYATVDYDQYVMGDYFATMGIPIIVGRGFERADGGSSRSVVVNETLAKRIWQERNPIGQRLRRDYWSKDWFSVIGVARDVKQGGVAHDAGTEMYFFVEQETVSPPATMNVVLRTTLPPAALEQTIERVVHNVDPTVPIVRLRDMDSVFNESIRRPRLLAQLLGAFAVLALLLAAIGTYGVLSYMVAEREREIGIRIALGAARAHVLALVIKQGLALTTIGVAIGLAGAFALNSLIVSLLFGVGPTDQATIRDRDDRHCGYDRLWPTRVPASRLDPNVVLRTN